MARPPVLSGFTCYHCGSDQTSKAGFARGKRRFYCRSCRRWFRENPVLPEGSKKTFRPRPKTLPSKSHLVLELQAISQRIGRTPTTNDINELSKQGRAYSLNTYYEAFGSFLEAVGKAGLKSHYKQKFDQEKLIHELRVLREKLKRPLLGKDVTAARKKGKVSSIYHFQREFGSIPKAIEAAGIKNHFQKEKEPTKYWQKYTLEELTEQLKAGQNARSQADDARHQRSQ